MNERQEKTHWQRLFQRAAEPLFLLDGERRILFVNLPFTQLTHFDLEQLRGRVCRHHLATTPGSEEALLSTLAPPREVLDGKIASVRRPAPLAFKVNWEIDFFPLGQKDELLAVLGKITATGTKPVDQPVPLPPRLLALRERTQRWHRLDHLRSDVPALRRVLEQVRLALRSTGPVWISGEPGVGKQWLARVIHNESDTREFGFAALDCRRLPPARILHELTGAQRSPGTIYLQQPQFLSKEVQARIADWFRGQSVESPTPKKSPRVLVGSALPPELARPDSALLEEFGLAFSALSISLPPVRERRADLVVLAQRLLERAAAAVNKPISGLSSEALEVLQAAAWPGNLRELYTVLRQACQRAKENVVEVGDLPWYLRDAPATPERTWSLDVVLEQVERRLVLLAMERSKQNKSRAADMLSIWRARLIRRLKELGIEDDAASTNPGV